MSDPQNFGLNELGQRLQALSDPVVEPRLRPYQGAPLPVGSPTAVPTAVPAPPSQNGQSPSSHSMASQELFSATFEHLQSQPLYTATSQHISAETFPGAGSYQGSQWVNQPNQPNQPESANSRNPVDDADRHLQETSSDPLEPAAQKALATVAEDPNASKSGFQRAIDAVRTALPLVQKLLPLLEGNFATVVQNLMTPPVHHYPPQPPVHIDMEPVERGMDELRTELRTGHRDLRTQLQEQTGNLKRVEDQLERVREATDRNTLEQQELVEDLRSVGNRIGTFAIVGLVLLAISLGLNIYFLVQLQHILR